MLINKLLPYCMFIPLAVLGGSGFCLFIKGLSNKITHIPGYNILNKRTYELYLYSDPINYILIFLFYKFYGEDFLFETNHVLIAVTLRLVITTVGALIVTYMIEHIKEKFAKYE